METRSVCPIARKALGNYSGVVQNGRIAIAQKYNVGLLMKFGSTCSIAMILCGYSS